MDSGQIDTGTSSAVACRGIVRSREVTSVRVGAMAPRPHDVVGHPSLRQKIGKIPGQCSRMGGRGNGPPGAAVRSHSPQPPTQAQARACQHVSALRVSCVTCGMLPQTCF